MFCKNCGTENEDGAKFCRGCGTIMEEVGGNAESGAASPVAAAQPTTAQPAAAQPTAAQPAVAQPAAAQPTVVQPAASKKPMNLKVLLPIIIGACAAVIALLVIILVIVTAKPTIKLDDYLTIEANGYDGYGTATAIIDWAGIEEKYGDKLDFTSQGEKTFSWLDPMSVLQLSISVTLDDTKGLSNGDVITYTWHVDEELYKYVKCNTKYSDDSYTVDGLEEVGTFDAFADLEVNFNGISPFATATYKYYGSQLTIYDFTFDKMSDLKNGDTITVSIADRGADYYIENYGMIPTSFEKEYVVSGLDEYVDSYEKLSDDFIAGLKSETEDTIYAYTAGSYNATSSMTDLTYAGYIFTSRKEGGYSSNYNMLYIIYSGTVSSSNGSFSTSKVYYPVRFTDILSSESGFSCSGNGSIVGSSNFDGSWSSTKGYINPLICYMDLVEAVRDNFTAECGDGFEAYAEYDLITTLADISDEYKAILYADAQDKIESYIATSYNGGSEASDLELLGEYLLLAKTQGTNFASNNKYIIVYSATVSNSQGRFDTTTVYFPVEYDGIVKLPGDEYMITNTVGMVNNSVNFPNSFYSTRGYLDGEEMYSKLITANRDNYTYEVSENLKQFGE
ncbi:MAG: zinc ribbon domain-containing protein [Lachnospiraceae bacterium]|nr:zinc ribbon domain-containing protein [Lachnospiraceae bacterium]